MADFSKVALGEGKIYYNYGETDEEELGYVRGGTFDEGLTIRHIEVDGKKSNLKGDAIVEQTNPVLDITFMEVTSDNFKKYFGYVTVDSTTPAETTIKRNYEILDEDYADNISYIGKKKNGKLFGVKILNALSTGSVNLAYADKGEVEIPAQFTGNGLTIDDTSAPYEILIDESV